MNPPSILQTASTKHAYRTRTTTNTHTRPPSRLHHSPTPPPLSPHLSWPISTLHLHPDDVADSTLLAIATVLLAINNRPMSVKDLADQCYHNGYLPSRYFLPAVPPSRDAISRSCSASAAGQMLSAHLRSHLKRHEHSKSTLLFLSHVLSGTDDDNTLLPALASRPPPGGFKRGTQVWYLSSALGVHCPFAAASIQLPSSIPECRKRKRHYRPSLDGNPPKKGFKIILRIPPSKPIPVDDVDTAMAAAESSSSFSLYSPVPPIAVPQYVPDVSFLTHRRGSSVLSWDSADLPPDSEDEDDDFHNSMLHGVDDDDYDDYSVFTPATTPESSLAISSNLPVKYEIKEEDIHNQAVLDILDTWDRVAVDEDEPMIARPELEWSVLKAEEDTKGHIFDAGPASPPFFDSSPSPLPSGSPAPVFVKQELTLPTIPQEVVAVELLSPTTDASRWVASLVLNDPSHVQGPESVLPHELDYAWGGTASKRPDQGRRASGRTGMAHRRPSLPRPSSTAVTPECLILRRPSNVNILPQQTQAPVFSPQQIFVNTCQTTSPAIIATILFGIPVYQTIVNSDITLLRRIDTDFVNVSSLLGLARKAEMPKSSPDFVVVSDPAEMAGSWGPLSAARDLVRRHTFDFRMHEILTIFLGDDLADLFPSPLPQVRATLVCARKSEAALPSFGMPFTPCPTASATQLSLLQQEIALLDADKDSPSDARLNSQPMPGDMWDDLLVFKTTEIDFVKAKMWDSTDEEVALAPEEEEFMAAILTSPFGKSKSLPPMESTADSPMSPSPSLPEFSQHEPPSPSTSCLPIVRRAPPRAVRDRRSISSKFFRALPDRQDPPTEPALRRSSRNAVRATKPPPSRRTRS